MENEGNSIHPYGNRDTEIASILLTAVQRTSRAAKVFITRALSSNKKIHLCGGVVGEEKDLRLIFEKVSLYTS